MLNGFDILEELGEISFDVIFTTAYDDFGIQAIKFSALDYLLKPIQNQELKKAIEKFANKGAAKKITPTHSLCPAMYSLWEFRKIRCLRKFRSNHHHRERQG